MARLKSIIGKAASSVRTKPRMVAGLLFLLGSLAAYFSRVERYDIEGCLSRILRPGNQCGLHVYYIWELLGLSSLLFVTAITVLTFSLQKKKV